MAMSEDFTARRRPQPAEDLSAETARWLDGLPAEVQPRRLQVEFPRIANTIAKRWTTPSLCLAYFEDLLVDRRGNRRGFPLTVMLELAELKSHFQLSVYPTPRTAWDVIMEQSRARKIPTA
jgi:hypothetical protein